MTSSGGQSRRHVGNGRRGRATILRFALGLPELLEAGETIQVLDVDALGRRGQHLASMPGDAEMPPLGQSYQPSLAQIALRPMDTVGKSRLPC